MSSWSLIYDTYEPEHEPLREALTTLGNGYFATRGASEESRADETHYPGTYLTNGYNRLTSHVADHRVTNEDLVNWPNWLPLTFCFEEGREFNLQGVEILFYKQALNLKKGILQRTVRFRDHEGRECTVNSRRLVHMGDPHCAAIEYSLTAHNWSGPLIIKSALDGSVINAGVARYRGLNSKHLNIIDLGAIDKDRLFLYAETNQSHIRMAQVARHSLFIDNKPIKNKPELNQDKECVAFEFKLNIEKEKTIRVEKIVSLYTSKDNAISECFYDAKIASQHLGTFSELLSSHCKAWQFLWHRSDVQMETRGKEQLILRLHIFHLLQTISLNSVYIDGGVPARGLHGEAYRGHIFWDELFIFPFYSYRLPEITRSLLLYRYHRLNMARYLAKEAGYKGAMYPWQSGSNGQEETQIVHLNPRSNTWGPDLSRYQRHVNAAIVYNIWQYYWMTKNTHFLAVYGAEMILEIARFFASIVTFNESKQRYEIHHVVGPDEYHEQYPDSDEPGINNNAYTNFMAVWVLERAIEVLSMLQPDRCNEIINWLNISDKEIACWHDITKKMFIPFIDEEIISQFEGYEHLKELDWGSYLKKYGNIERLDRVLKAENDSPNNYQVAKQADVLMLFFLFSQEELIRIFHQLGYQPFDEECICKTIEFYQKRTSHGSTLSKVVFASELRCIDEDAARNHFEEALISDISDTQGGTTPEGIHLGAMSGTVDIVMRQYAGILGDHEGLHFRPHLPNDINKLQFRIQHHGNWYRVYVDHKLLRLTLEPGKVSRYTVTVFGKAVTLEAGKEQDFEIYERTCKNT